MCETVRGAGLVAASKQEGKLKQSQPARGGGTTQEPQPRAEKSAPPAPAAAASGKKPQPQQLPRPSSGPSAQPAPAARSLGRSGDPPKGQSGAASRAALRPDQDDYDWGRLLWDAESDRATFRVAPPQGAELRASLPDKLLAGAFQCQHLLVGARAQLGLGAQRQHIDRFGTRWVQVEVASGASGAAATVWWARWADLELVPGGVTSAAHEEDRVDKVMSRQVKEGMHLTNEEYQRAWWHRMGYAVDGPAPRTAADASASAYVQRVRSVELLREMRCSATSSGGNAHTGRTGDPAGGESGRHPGSPPSAELPQDFATGDWSVCPRVHALSPGAIPGRVSVVCPTFPTRHHLHESLYRCFLSQAWPDKELIVLDTGGGPSPFFSRRPSSGSARAGRSPCPAEDPRVLYAHVPHYPLTLGHKRNQLIQMASGEFIAHFDDDNLYAPQYLAAMVAQLRASRAQLVRLQATFGWEPQAGTFRWHAEIAFRAETFVHVRCPLRAVAFAHKSCGEEGGIGAVCVVHDVDDTYGMFLHVEHGGNASSYNKVGDTWDRGQPVALLDIPNSQLHSAVAAHRGFFV